MTDEDIHVEMKVESVIMEGCRRIDEWELIFATLGSLERVPRLRYNNIVEEDGGVKLRYWFLGFLDGDGCICVPSNQNSRQKAKMIFRLF